MTVDKHKSDYKVVFDNYASTTVNQKIIKINKSTASVKLKFLFSVCNNYIKVSIYTFIWKER